MNLLDYIPCKEEHELKQRNMELTCAWMVLKEKEETFLISLLVGMARAFANRLQIQSRPLL